MTNRVYTSSGYREDNFEMHYGQGVDLTKPVPSVITNHYITWLDDDIRDGIDLSWEAHKDECKGQCEHCNCKHEDMVEDDKPGCICSECEEHEYEPDPDNHENCGPAEQGPEVLIGDWKLVDGKYEPDQNGKHGYAAVVGEIYTQVLWSKTVRRVRSLCSPCYPGQADLDRPDRTLRIDDVVRYTKDSPAVASGIVPYANPELDFIVKEVVWPEDGSAVQIRVAYKDVPDDEGGPWIPFNNLELVNGYLAYDLPADMY